MKKVELEQLLSDISDRVSYYKYENVDYRSYYLILANGDRIRVQFPEFSIPHLLGVNTNYLSSTGLFKEKSTMALLNEMCDNEFRIYSNIKNGIISDEKLFSKHVKNKVKSFVENLKIDIYGIEFVCKYDKSKAHILGQEGLEYDYLMCKRNNEGKYFVLGLVQNENGVYVPRSNQYFENREELEIKYSNILNNQSFTFISNVDVRDFNKFALNASAKMRKTIGIEEYASKFGGYVDVTGEYKFSLSKYQSNISNGILLTKEYESIISSCMENGELIEPESFGLSNFSTINASLVQIIMSYNNMITSSSIEKSDSVNSKYSKLIEELKELRNECKNLKIRNENLSNENNKLVNENNDLLNENKGYADAITAIENQIIKVKSTK
ncbi:MAG: hypothetical protein PUD59_00530 [bacterium]|nr:hypothetical protein [bacterium]